MRVPEEYWIINPRAAEIEVHRLPPPPGQIFGTGDTGVRKYQKGQFILLLAKTDTPVAVNDLLP